MIEMAVVNRAETFERMREPLGRRGIGVRHVPVTERTVGLTEGVAGAGQEVGHERRERPADGGDGEDGDGDAADRGTDDPIALGAGVDPGVEVGFVYPSRTMEGGVADALLDVPWLNGRRAVLTSRNKAGVIARLDRAGLPVPDSVLVSDPVEAEDLERAFDRFDPPVVVKPNSTTRGIGVTRVGDRDSFLGVADYLDLVHDYRATGDKSFLVQEYLPDARDYRVMVLDGEYVGAVERRLPGGGWKHNVHRGAVAEAVDASPELRDLAERTAAVLDIDFLGVDLLVAPDRTVVNETNARPTIDDAAKYEDGFYDRLAATIERRV